MVRTICLLCCAAVSFAQIPELRLQKIAGGFSSPLAIEFFPDGSGRAAIVEQSGRIRIIKNGRVLDQPFLDWRTRVSCCGERGLLGIAFPPGFTTKQRFYINYTGPGGNTVVSRLQVSPDRDVADPATEQVILTAVQPEANHNGGGLAFNPQDGFLYIGLGDGGGAGDPRGNAQRADTLLGKMLRIDVESGQTPYRVPPENPFAARQDARPEIWALGLRNPWRYSFDRETNDLWIADVGQGRAEEINFQPAASKGGENYGWNKTEGLECYPPGAACNKTGLTLPVLEYGRSLGISITGGYVYRGSRYPALRGSYLYGDYGTGNLWILQQGTGSPSNVLASRTGLNITAFGQDQSGELYLADYAKGDIYAILSGRPSFAAAGVVNAASFRAGLVPGSLASVFGTGIAQVPGLLGADRVPLPFDLSGVAVRINDIPAPVLAVAWINGQEQINLQIPWELAGQTEASVVVTSNGRASDPVRVSIVQAQPEIFAVTRSGDSISVWATGLGAVARTPATGAATLEATPATLIPDVRVNGERVPVTFAGLPTLFVGLYQINAVVPATASGEMVIQSGSVSSVPFRF